MGDRRRFLRVQWNETADPPRSDAVRGREAERRQLTVMFADLVGSTTLATERDPEDMKELIDRFQRSVRDEVTRYGGYVAKPLGDGLLIYFGWPQAHEDDAERAVRSAVATIAAVQNLTAGGMALAVRIGIATGDVVVGDFTGAGVDEIGGVVGETPNLAARLQAAAAANTVVVAETTMKLVGKQFLLTDLGEQSLKGFDNLNRIWRVDGERLSESRFDLSHMSSRGQFVGREHEIGMLRQHWEEARDGECQLVLVTGKAGIGKSRLVSEALGRLEGVARRIIYQASPLHTNTPLYPVAQYLRSKARFNSEDTAGGNWSKLAAVISSQSLRRSNALRFLAELMSIVVPTGEPTGSQPSAEEQREAALEVLADVAGTESEAGPLLIIVEDAHWLDATTIEYIDRVLERLQHSPAMVVVTYRPDFVPPWMQHSNVGLLSLSRLGRHYARAIVDALLAQGQNLPKGIAEEILAKSDGIPLFLEELTGSALEAVRASGDHLFQIPATLRNSLSERLDRLGSAKEVAQIAAAFGREFAADLVAATLERSEAELQADLDRLMAIDVVYQNSRSSHRYTFRHALLQEAAYESMLKSRRRDVHSRIAEVLIHHKPEVAEAEPEVLATHLARSGNTAGAAEYWRRAGHRASKNSAYLEAIGAFENALSFLPETDVTTRVDINRAIASAYFASGDYISMRKYLEHAATDAEATGNHVIMAEIAMQQGHVLNVYGGSLLDAVEFGERALQIATQLDDDALAYGARFSLGQSASIGGDFIKAISFFRANLPENVRDPERVRDFGTAGSLMINSLSMLGSCLAHCGEFDQAAAVLDRAEQLAPRTDFDIWVRQFHRNRAHLQKGDASTALPGIIKAVRHVEQAGWRFAWPWHHALLGYAYALTGEVDQGVLILNQALNECDTAHLPYAKSFTSVFLAETLLSREPERALDVAERGLKVATAGGYRAQEAELLRIKASALLGDDPAEAEARAKEGLALARELAMRPEEAHALRVLGDISAAYGQSGSARENHDHARALYKSLGMSYWLERPGLMGSDADAR